MAAIIRAADASRDRKLARLGYRVVRLEAERVLRDLSRRSRWLERRSRCAATRRRGVRIRTRFSRCQGSRWCSMPTQLASSSRMANALHAAGGVYFP